ncbi:hypothetical protein Droror1_Dr00015258 [Drosera rotundifolia]
MVGLRVEEIVAKMMERMEDDVSRNEVIEAQEDEIKGELQGVLNSCFNDLRKEFHAQMEEVRSVVVSLQEVVKNIKKGYIAMQGGYSEWWCKLSKGR